MPFRDDVEALSARKTTLEIELRDKQAEHHQVAELLREAQARRNLPVLDNIQSASPCAADWQQMIGDARARRCHKCDNQVFNLSAMTRSDAEAFMIERNGAQCARYFQRSDGTFLTQDCQVGIAARRKRKLVAAVTIAVLITGAGIGALIYHRTVQDRGETGVFESQRERHFRCGNEY